MNNLNTYQQFRIAKLIVGIFIGLCISNQCTAQNNTSSELHGQWVSSVGPDALRSLEFFPDGTFKDAYGEVLNWKLSEDQKTLTYYKGEYNEPLTVTIESDKFTIHLDDERLEYFRKQTEAMDGAADHELANEPTAEPTPFLIAGCNPSVLSKHSDFAFLSNYLQGCQEKFGIGPELITNLSLMVSSSKDRGNVEMSCLFAKPGADLQSMIELLKNQYSQYQEGDFEGRPIHQFSNDDAIAILNKAGDGIALLQHGDKAIYLATGRSADQHMEHMHDSLDDFELRTPAASVALDLAVVSSESELPLLKGLEPMIQKAPQIKLMLFIDQGVTVEGFLDVANESDVDFVKAEVEKALPSIKKMLESELIPELQAAADKEQGFSAVAVGCAKLILGGLDNAEVQVTKSETSSRIHLRIPCKPAANLR